MITLEEARSRLLALAQPLASQTLEIDQCYARYLANDLYAKRTQPAADLSAMDGYAVRFADLSEPLSVVGESAAGKPFNGIVGTRQAVRIFTGAHVPQGADCVVMQEDFVACGKMASLCGDGPSRQGAHIRRAGSDFLAGQKLLTAGQFLNAGAISAAIMGGYGALDVGRKPKIAIIGSGDELVPPGYETDASQIPSSNNDMLCAMLRHLPCDIFDFGTVNDNVDTIKSTLKQCADADIIVTSGGASVGDHDLIQTALKEMGAQIDFWRVAVKPGKPVLAGHLGSSIVIGLPGNPGSAFVTAYLFLMPMVRHLSGCTQPWPIIYQTFMQTGLPAAGQRTEFLRAVLNENGITPLLQQDSGLTSSLAAANALIIRPAGAEPVYPGDLIAYHLL